MHFHDTILMIRLMKIPLHRVLGHTAMRWKKRIHSIPIQRRVHCAWVTGIGTRGCKSQEVPSGSSSTLSGVWTAIDHVLGILDPSDNFPHCKASGEWLNDNAGWMRSPATISVLFSRRSLHPGPRDYTVEDFYHCSLISIIHKRVLDISHHKSFHFEPYELRWHPLHKACDVGCMGSYLPPRHFLKPTGSCRNLLLSQVASYRIGWSH
jgi:hypothetical protein